MAGRIGRPPLSLLEPGELVNSSIFSRWPVSALAKDDERLVEVGLVPGAFMSIRIASELAFEFVAVVSSPPRWEEVMYEDVLDSSSSRTVDPTTYG